MRLWTLHPKHLDARGLVALWREALLAQRVLQGRTRGYRHHPQLKRFQAAHDPVAAIASYLAVIHVEATRRGYHFDASKIGHSRFQGRIPETRGQLLYEWEHLRRKLALRDPAWLERCRASRSIAHHSLFRIVAGEVRDWEKLPDKAQLADQLLGNEK